MAKKYFWLKLKDNFFSDKRIKKLRRVAGGDTYTLIYLKMQLLSLKNEGKLIYEQVEDTFEEELALELDESVDNVTFTVMFLKANGLLEECEENEFVLIETMNSIGRESESAERVRRFRDNQKQQKALQCNVTDVTCNTEIEKEKEKEKDIKTKKKITNPSEEELMICKFAIDYLNQQANKRYRHTDTNIKHIYSVLKKGFKTDDIKYVIDVKVQDWLNDEKHNKYLRPETLFGNKFEGYLNQPMKITSNQQQLTSSPIPPQKVFDPSTLFD